MATKTDKPAPQAPAEKPFKVRAIDLGYYDHVRRRIGDVFVVASEKDFSSRWMVRVGANTPERVTTGRESLRQQHDDVLGGVALPQGAAFADDADSNPLNA